jgi:hypothetical protein
VIRRGYVPGCSKLLRETLNYDDERAGVGEEERSKDDVGGVDSRVGDCGGAGSDGEDSRVDTDCTRAG